MSQSDVKISFADICKLAGVTEKWYDEYIENLVDLKGAARVAEDDARYAVAVRLPEYDNDEKVIATIARDRVLQMTRAIEAPFRRLLMEAAGEVAETMGLKLVQVKKYRSLSTPSHVRHREPYYDVLTPISTWEDSMKLIISRTKTHRRLTSGDYPFARKAAADQVMHVIKWDWPKTTGAAVARAKTVEAFENLRKELRGQIPHYRGNRSR